jgi:2'-5' RNA ligase
LSAEPHAPPLRRLFLALWPEASMRARLAEAVYPSVSACAGQAVPASHYHLTLVFIGAVPETRLEALDVAIKAAARHFAGTSSIEMALQDLVYWSAPRVLCAVPRTAPAGLAERASAVRAALVTAGFAPDLKPFRPHVTVARKVKRPSDSVLPDAVLWRFDACALIDSRTVTAGPVYSVVQTYPLVGGVLAAK